MEKQPQPARIVAVVATTSQLSPNFTATQLEVLKEVADSMTDTPSVGQRFLSPAQLEAALQLVAAGWLVRVKPGKFVRYEISPAGQPDLAPVLQALSQLLDTPAPMPAATAEALQELAACAVQQFGVQPVARLAVPSKVEAAVARLDEAETTLMQAVAHAKATHERSHHADGVIDITTPVGKAWAEMWEAADRLEDLQQDIERDLDRACGGRKAWRRFKAAAEVARRKQERDIYYTTDRQTAASQFNQLAADRANFKLQPWARKDLGKSVLSLLKFLRTSHNTTSWALPPQLPLCLLLLGLLLGSSSCTNKLSAAYVNSRAERATPARPAAADTVAAALPATPN